MSKYEVSLNKYPYHKCCDESSMFLFPPRKEGEEQRHWGKVHYKAIDTWCLDNGDGGEFMMNVKFCPWCGVELPYD